jgi:hypothetical protein
MPFAVFLTNDAARDLDELSRKNCMKFNYQKPDPISTKSISFPYLFAWKDRFLFGKEIHRSKILHRHPCRVLPKSLQLQRPEKKCILPLKIKYRVE